MSADENTELFKSYQKILKICTEHMKNCGAFEKQVIEEFEFDE